MDKIVRIYGGLGNQIFQYLYGQYLADKTGAEVYFYYGVTKSKKAEKRDFELQRVFPEIRVKSNWIIAFMSKYKIIEFIFRKTRPLQYLFRVIFEHRENGYSNNVVNRGRLFVGYWQNVDMLKDQLELIRCSNWSARLTPLLGDAIYTNIDKNSVALHVRRGDYLKLSTIYHRVTMEYYLTALRLISKDYVVSKVFVFSDDIEWCRENLDLVNYDVQYMDKGGVVEDFAAISNCKHKIIANSTFSLLAALLSPQDGLIIAPEYWANGSHDIILTKEIIRIAN